MTWEEMLRGILANHKKEALNARVVSFAGQDLESERAAVHKAIQEIYGSIFELEVRAQGVLSGFIATPDQIKEGVQALEDDHFPFLRSEIVASIFGRKKGSGGGNTCHDAQGRFCGTGTDEAYKEGKKLVKKEMDKAKIKASPEENDRQIDLIMEAGKRISAEPDPDKKQAIAEEMVKGYQQAPNAKAVARSAQQARGENEHGFTQAQLDTEKQVLIGLASQARSAWSDISIPNQMEARARALSQGRIATRSEINSARHQRTPLLGAPKTPHLNKLGIIVT